MWTDSGLPPASSFFSRRADEASSGVSFLPRTTATVAYAEPRFTPASSSRPMKGFTSATGVGRWMATESPTTIGRNRRPTLV